MFEVILIIFSILAVVFFLGMIGDKDVNNRKNFTHAFCVLAIAITLMLVINNIF